MKKAKVISLLLLKNRPTYRKISEIVGCNRSYAEKLADMLGICKKVPIMDFRGLLKGNICREK